MKFKGSSGRAKKDLRDHCESIDVRAEDEHDAVFMAHLYRAIAMGGTVTIQTWDGELTEECFKARPERRCPDCGSSDVYPRRNDGVWEAKCPDCGAVVGLDQANVIEIRVKS